MEGEMTRKCTICAHSRREEIDQAIVDGVPYRSIAGQFSLSKSAVERHAKNHLPRTLAKAHEAKEVARADDLLTRAKEYEDKAVALLDKAEEDGDYRTALRGIKEARSCLELLARLRGELEAQREAEVITIDQIEGWDEIQKEIVDALKPYPEAREALRQALLNFVEGNQG